MYRKLTFPGAAVSDETLTTWSVAVGPAVAVSVGSTRPGRSHATWATHPPYKQRSNILGFGMLRTACTLIESIYEIKCENS